MPTIQLHALNTWWTVMHSKWWWRMQEDLIRSICPASIHKQKEQACQLRKNFAYPVDSFQSPHSVGRFYLSRCPTRRNMVDIEINEEHIKMYQISQFSNLKFFKEISQRIDQCPWIFGKRLSVGIFSTLKNWKNLRERERDIQADIWGSSQDLVRKIANWKSLHSKINTYGWKSKWLFRLNLTYFALISSAHQWFRSEGALTPRWKEEFKFIFAILIH